MKSFSHYAANGANPFSHASESMRQATNDNYLTFEGVMNRHGYTWDAHEVETEDGFTLTTFHVTGKIVDGQKVVREPTEAPLLI